MTEKENENIFQIYLNSIIATQNGIYKDAIRSIDIDYYPDRTEQNRTELNRTEQTEDRNIYIYKKNQKR